MKVIIDLVGDKITFTTSSVWLQKELQRVLVNLKIENTRFHHGKKDKYTIYANASQFQSIDQIRDILNVHISSKLPADKVYAREPLIEYRFGSKKPTNESLGNADEVLAKIMAKIQDSKELNTHPNPAQQAFAKKPQ